MNYSKTRRCGIVLICVVACLLIATSLAALSIQSTLRYRREIKLSSMLHQTNLALDAGVLRAIDRAKQAANYEGEIWRPNVSPLEGIDVELDIVVKPSRKIEDARVRLITVQALLVLNQSSMESFRMTRSIQIQLTGSSDKDL